MEATPATAAGAEETGSQATLNGPFQSCVKTPINPMIRVDQFGYRPSARKFAVLSDPIEGWNAADQFRPGATYEVRSWADGKLVFSGAPRIWNNGAIQKSSGDRGSWFDFSSVVQEGSYCLLDSERGFRSDRFDIRGSVYRDALRAAVKVFYFQRANFAKRKPFACVGDKCWIAAPDYVGPRQDKEARSVRARDDAKTARDLSGGWWDAGDVNKYVTFARAPLHQLLTTYAARPQVFGDDFVIPESGNGVPDLLDELKVELDWLMKMQPTDLGGGVLPKVGNVDFKDPLPEKSRFPRFYYPEPCSSATITVAGVFAHAALVMRQVPELKTYAAELSDRAVKAWTHFQQHPRKDDCDDMTIKAGDSDDDLTKQEQANVVAAIYLFGLTGESGYAEVVAKGLAALRPMKEDGWSSYEPEQGEALLYYAALPNADAKLKATILDRKRSTAQSAEIYSLNPERDLYRAYMPDGSYHWGHNMVRANVGNTNYEMVGVLGSSPQATAFAERAENLLHWFHGINPLGLVYLTNMSSYGAERSLNEIYHAWFRDGDPELDSAKTSRLGPPPGYVPGGPNPQYCKDQDPQQNACANSQLRKQPAQKAYLDFNTAWQPTVEHDRSWELTEPAIYYQAAYVELVSKFVE
ncbi:MAG TPA: glycoside hydrolase family 9 protein [Polyangiaceae bacterium]|nr:glycoside hydrolase family 9 protein [Polyangiaceae bacterium]